MIHSATTAVDATSAGTFVGGWEAFLLWFGAGIVVIAVTLVLIRLSNRRYLRRTAPRPVDATSPRGAVAAVSASAAAVGASAVAAVSASADVAVTTGAIVTNGLSSARQLGFAGK